MVCDEARGVSSTLFASLGGQRAPNTASHYLTNKAWRYYLVYLKKGKNKPQIKSAFSILFFRFG